jgi:hypothetical protein
MRPMFAPILLLSALACNEGRIEFDLDDEALSDDDEPGTTDGSGSSSGSGGSTGSGGGDGDTTDPDDGPDDAGSRWAGAYEGEQSLGLTAPNGEWVDLCWGEATWEVTEGGDLLGRGECEMQRGPASGEFLLFDYEGTVDADGIVWGDAVLTRSWMDARDELELEAWIGEDGGERWIEAWMTGTIETRDGDAPVEGWAWGGSW